MRRVVPLRRPPHQGALRRPRGRIESTARQRESLVTLGTLAAGLAHELNNPAAAATRAVDSLAGGLRDAACRRWAASRRARSPPSSSAHWTICVATSSLVTRPSRTRWQLPTRRRRFPPGSLSRGVERDWVIAPPLAAAGVDVAWCERAASVLGDAALEPGLEWVASTLSHDHAARPR